MPEHLMLSFHGIPQRYFVQGDPYHCHCMKTARLVKEELGWEEKKFHVTFQSRFGSEPWLQPYTDETLEKLGAEGVKSLAIMAPGFSADCLETLEELAMEGRESFKVHGGGSFDYVPCLNASADSLLTPTHTRSSANVCCNSFICGMAARQGPHQVAQKSITTVLFFMSGRLLTHWATENSGASSPCRLVALPTCELWGG